MKNTDIQQVPIKIVTNKRDSNKTHPDANRFQVVVRSSLSTYLKKKMKHEINMPTTCEV